MEAIRVFGRLTTYLDNINQLNTSQKLTDFETSNLERIADDIHSSIKDLAKYLSPENRQMLDTLSQRELFTVFNKGAFTGVELQRYYDRNIVETIKQIVENHQSESFVELFLIGKAKDLYCNLKVRYDSLMGNSNYNDTVTPPPHSIKTSSNRYDVFLWYI